MSRHPGFTLIEVLVATAVMAIMVLMLGGVFQQASSSWDSGYARAEGGMAVRAVVGALTRDLATAVDGRRYGLATPISPDSGASTSLTFYRLVDGMEGGVEQVVYGGGAQVTRNGKTLYSPGDNGNAASFKFYVGDGGGALRSYETKFYGEDGSQQSSSFPGQVKWNVPWVKVRCEMTRKGNITGLAVRSFGKDGVKDTADDIVVK